MNRRNFLQLAGATAGASVMNGSAALPQSSNGSKSRKGLMKVGTQHGSSDDILEVLCSLGVNNICSSLPSAKMDANWSVEALTKLRERVESYGIHLDMIPLPLSSAYITKAELPSIMMAKMTKDVTLMARKTAENEAMNDRDSSSSLCVIVGKGPFLK